MAHIELPGGLPGISAGFNFRPDTAKPMRALAHILLHEPSSLTPGERELIATYVSSRNCTTFCALSHGAAATAHLGRRQSSQAGEDGSCHRRSQSKTEGAAGDCGGKVQQDGKLVTADDVDAARGEGATDLEIHDTVLIAAAFCMYNRYVNGLVRGSRLIRQCMSRWANVWQRWATTSLRSGNRWARLKLKRRQLSPNPSELQFESTIRSSSRFLLSL